MSDITEPQPQTDKIPDTGNPMNLTCVGTVVTAEGTTQTIHIYLVAPGASWSPPANSTPLVQPDSSASYTLSGTGPDGNPIPGKGISIPGGGIAVYSVP